MGNGAWNIKRLIQFVLVSACVLMLVLLFAVEDRFQTDYLTDVKFTNEDGKIRITWDVPLLSPVSGVYISLSSEEKSFSEIVSPRDKEYEFTEGEHGTRYDISLCELHDDGYAGVTYSEQYLFLDYAQLPDFPTIYIETDMGEEPSSEIAERPNDLVWGATSVNNEYVYGNLVFVRGGYESVSTKMRMRVRGNTSSLVEKKPYKLKLNSPVDMLAAGDEYADTEWTLLNVGNSLNTYVGEYLSETCGMEWVSNGIFVNLMMNGDWRGLYYLYEAVSRGEMRGNVGETGYIFENDAYWWKPDTVYFKLDNQIYQMGFTFKYPTFINADDKRIEELKQYMETVTGLITSGQESALEYIDLDTFTSWIMVRDIMHTGDGGGSNMYYYLHDLNTADYTANKLKMGPVWDFDAGIRGGEYFHEDVNSWSASHTLPFTYFPYLFEMPEFCGVYKDKWERVSEELGKGFDAHMESLVSTYGASLNESRELDSARWGTEMVSVEEEIAYDSDFIRQRIKWIDSAVEDW